jgi:prepilin-type N-terminal cleavage/methylation domain-containing protein
MKSTNKAFTLVELIVVITILAILGTIAFISLQGYSSDARNSKRISDLGNIQSAITLKGVEGVPLMSFVTENDDNPMDLIALG